jgi:hypothetical protein
MIQYREYLMIKDFSAIWDWQCHSDGGDYAIMLLDRWESTVTELVDKEPQRAVTLIQMVVTGDCYSVFWRRILRIGASRPVFFAQHFGRNLTSAFLLTGFDTGYLAGECLGAVFPHMNVSDRAQVEEILAKIVEEDNTLSDSRRKPKVGALLARLDSSLLTSPELTKIREQYVASGRVPAPPFMIHSDSTPFRSDETYEIPLQAKSLRDRVRAWCKPNSQEKPTLEEIAEIAPALAELWRYAASLPVSEDPGEVMGVLAGAASCAARRPDLSPDSAEGKLVKQILLSASKHEEPRPNADIDKQFERGPSWGAPVPRIEAAQGLMQLCQNPTNLSPELVTVIFTLADDPVPAVRFQVATGLLLLYSSSQPTLWELAQHICNSEQSPTILKYLASAVLYPLERSAKETNAIELVNSLLRRFPATKPNSGLRGECAKVLTDSVLRWKDSVALTVLKSLLTNPLECQEECKQVIQLLRNPLIEGLCPGDTQNARVTEIRTSARELLHIVVEAVDRKLAELDASDNSAISATREQRKALYSLIDEVAMQVYFASGALDVKSGNSGRLPEPKAFVSEIAPLMERVSDFGLPSGVHALLQTLRFIVNASASKVFWLTSRCLRAAAKFNYQADPLGVRELVGLVETLMLDHASVFIDDSLALAELVDVIGMIIDSGWPEGRRLGYRLGEMFK